MRVIKISRYSLYISVLQIILLLIFNGCSGDDSEKELRSVIKSMIRCAEEQDNGSLMNHISSDYFDSEERDRSDLEFLSGQYFDRFKGINVNLLGLKIEHISESEAILNVEVSVSSGFGKIFRKIMRFYGKILRFDVELRKEDMSWKVTSAVWEEISAYELLPSSLKVLKKLFPSSF